MSQPLPPGDYGAMVQKVLGPSWWTQDPSVVLEVLRKALGTTDPVAEAKVFFLQEILDPPPRSLFEEFLFEKLVVAFSGDVPDFEVWQPRVVEQLAYAVRQVRKALPDAVLGDDVQAYIAASCLNDGCWCAPPTLAFVRARLRAAMERRGVTDLPPLSAVEAVYARIRNGGDPPADTPADVLVQVKIWLSSEEAA